MNPPRSTTIALQIIEQLDQLGANKNGELTAAAREDMSNGTHHETYQLVFQTLWDAEEYGPEFDREDLNADPQKALHNWLDSADFDVLITEFVSHKREFPAPVKQPDPKWVLKFTRDDKTHKLEYPTQDAAIIGGIFYMRERFSEILNTPGTVFNLPRVARQFTEALATITTWGDPQGYFDGVNYLVALKSDLDDKGEK